MGWAGAYSCGGRRAGELGGWAPVGAIRFLRTVLVSSSMRLGVEREKKVVVSVSRLSLTSSQPLRSG